jgi:hypothetical protein
MKSKPPQRAAGAVWVVNLNAFTGTAGVWPAMRREARTETRTTTDLTKTSAPLEHCGAILRVSLRLPPDSSAPMRLRGWRAHALLDYPQDSCLKRR